MELASRSVGRSGVAVTTVGLGCVEIGPAEGEEPDVGRAVTVLESSLAAGINWLDTSENYHDTKNESLIGEGLRRVEGELLVATKVAPGGAGTGGGSGFRPEQVRAACQASLRRLGRECIDIYFCTGQTKRGFHSRRHAARWRNWSTRGLPERSGSRTTT